MTAPSNVFVDTNIFIGDNFFYGGRRLGSLTKLAKAREVQVLLTDVTVEEMRSNLKKKIRAACSFNPPDNILKNSQDPAVKALFVRPSRDALITELNGQLDVFLEDARVEVLDVRPEDLPAVLNDYFQQKAPFGPGKKKSEFPDAFALGAIRQWGVDHGEPVAVVSDDKGVREACDGHDLVPFETLAGYLDAFLVESEALPQFFEEMIQSREDEVLPLVEHEFTFLGFGLIDEDGDVEYAQLKKLEFTDMVEIVSLDMNAASVEMPAVLSFSADIRYVEPGSGIYDSEEGVMLFESEISQTVEREVTRNIGLDVVYNNLSVPDFAITRVWIADSADIEIEAYEGCNPWDEH